MYYKTKAILQAARDNDITLHKGSERNKHKQGIHILNPDEQELVDALDTAIKDMYHDIYIYEAA